jgi:hypothetical protein
MASSEVVTNNNEGSSTTEHYGGDGFLPRTGESVAQTYFTVHIPSANYLTTNFPSTYK